MSADELDLSKAPLLSHLLELRRRLLICVALFILAFGLSYYFADMIYHFLVQPLAQVFGDDENRRLIYTGLHEAFFTYLKLSFFTAMFCTLPLILIQIWKFIAPGLYKNERRSLVPLFVMTPILFLLGAALAFYVVMPLAWNFFVSFESFGDGTGLAVQLEARISEYLDLVIKLLLAFGLSFELPILLLVLAKVGLVTAQGLREYRRHAIVVAFLLAAFITPPDLISQIALGTPIVLLYEFSIRLILWTGANKAGVTRQQAIQY